MPHGRADQCTTTAASGSLTSYGLVAHARTSTVTTERKEETAATRSISSSSMHGRRHRTPVPPAPAEFNFSGRAATAGVVRFEGRDQLAEGRAVVGSRHCHLVVVGELGTKERARAVGTRLLLPLRRTACLLLLLWRFDFSVTGRSPIVIPIITLQTAPQPSPSGGITLRGHVVRALSDSSARPLPLDQDGSPSVCEPRLRSNHSQIFPALLTKQKPTRVQGYDY